MLPPLPRCSGWAYSSLIAPSRLSLPRKGSPGRPAHRPFRGLLGVHSRCGLHTGAVTVIRDPLSEGFRHFVSSMPAPVASGWSESPGGACTHWKAPPCHGAPPLRSLLGTKGGGRSQISDAPPSPQSSNLRVGPHLAFHIVTAGPEDDASGAAGLELGETFAQLLASSCEGHLFGGGYVDERVMAVRNVEGMTAVNGEVADVFVRTFDASQP